MIWLIRFAYYQKEQIVNLLLERRKISIRIKPNQNTLNLELKSFILNRINLKITIKEKDHSIKIKMLITKRTIKQVYMESNTIKIVTTQITWTLIRSTTMDNLKTTSILVNQLWIINRPMAKKERYRSTTQKNVSKMTRSLVRILLRI